MPNGRKDETQKQSLKEDLELLGQGTAGKTSTRSRRGSKVGAQPQKKKEGLEQPHDEGEEKRERKVLEHERETSVKKTLPSCRFP